VKKIYIASPYTIGDVAVNVRRQLEAADTLIDLGFAPFVPLYSHFQHMHSPKDYDVWLRLDLEWLPACDALLRLPGESKGADHEEVVAKSLGIPVFYSVDSLVRWANLAYNHHKTPQNQTEQLHKSP
jgi:hypothetical protein